MLLLKLKEEPNRHVMSRCAACPAANASSSSVVEGHTGKLPQPYNEPLEIDVHDSFYLLCAKDCGYVLLRVPLISGSDPRVLDDTRSETAISSPRSHDCT